MKKAMLAVLMSGLVINSAQAGFWDSITAMGQGISQFSQETQKKLFAGAAIISGFTGIGLGYKLYQHRGQQARKEECRDFAEMVRSFKERQDQEKATRTHLETMDICFNPLQKAKRDVLVNNHNAVAAHIRKLRLEDKPLSQKFELAKLSPNQLMVENVRQDVVAAGEVVYNALPSSEQVNTAASNIGYAFVNASSQVVDKVSPSAIAVGSAIKTTIAGAYNCASVVGKQTIASQLSPACSSSSSSSSRDIEMARLK